MIKYVLNSINNKYGDTLLNQYGTIFHYTNFSGLEGIISSNNLWATNSAFLNDKLEIKYAYATLNIIIQDYAKQFKDNRKKFFMELQSYLLKHPIPEVYVISFSRNYDSLSQWRGYSDRGDSYCLSFNSVFLKENFIGKGDLMNVIYNVDTFEALIHTIFESAIAYMNTQSNSFDFSYIPELYDTIELFLPAYKHHGFFEENEVRFVIRNDSIQHHKFKIKERQGSGYKIPYIELDFINSVHLPEDIPLEEILIGPAKDQKLAEASIKSLFQSNNFYIHNPLFRINTSDIPLRID